MENFQTELKITLVAIVIMVAITIASISIAPSSDIPGNGPMTISDKSMRLPDKGLITIPDKVFKL